MCAVLSNAIKRVAAAAISKTSVEEVKLSGNNCDSIKYNFYQETQSGDRDMATNGDAAPRPMKRVAPDGGWGWMACFGVSLVNVSVIILLFYV